MRKYIQLTLHPDEASGISAPVLMSHVMEKLHLSFVNIKDDTDHIPVGISFPEYDPDAPSLGRMVRLHGEEDRLNHLDIRRTMISFRDYIHLTDLRQIPEAILKGYVSYARVRHDHGRDKLVRRHMKRHGLTLEEAGKIYENYQTNPFPAYPFVLMPSQSTGHQKYPLCLKQIFLEEPGQGYFNTFGINPDAGVENW